MRRQLVGRLSTRCETFACVGPLARIEPVALRFQCPALRDGSLFMAGGGTEEKRVG